MKRKLLCLSLLLTGLLVLITVNLNPLSSVIGYFPAHSQFSQNNANRQRPEAIFDGSVNPGSIPDHVAYDILFRIFSAPEDNELDREKKRVYAQLAGFDETETSLSQSVAQEYDRRIRALNAKIKDVKDRHWPNPGSAAIGQLRQLKEEKQNLISSVITDFQIRAAANSADYQKVHRFVSEYIKPRIKGFGTDPSQPKRKTGSLIEKVSNIFSSYAQASYCGGFVYAYSNISYSMSLCYLWGDGSYYAEPDSCGHTYSTMITTTGPGGIYQSGSSGTSIYLIDGNGFPIAGNFYSETEVEGFCSIVNQAFFAAFTGGQQSLANSIRISEVRYIPDEMNPSGGASTFRVSISPSNALQSTNVTIEITEHNNINSVPLIKPLQEHLTKTESVIGASLGGGVKHFDFPFETSGTNSTKGPLQYRAEIVSPTGSLIMGSASSLVTPPNRMLCVGNWAGSPSNCPFP